MGSLLFPSLFVVVGLLVFVYGFILSRKTVRFLRNAKLTKGTLVEWRADGRQKHRTMYQPIFRYEDAHGVERENGLDESTSHPPYKVGAERELIVGTNDPNKIAINSFAGKWLGVLLVFAIAGVFMLIGFVFALIELLSRW